MTRVSDRHDFDIATRLTLIESDLDKIEARLDVIQRLMISILAAITIAAVTGIVNLIAR